MNLKFVSLFLILALLWAEGCMSESGRMENEKPSPPEALADTGNCTSLDGLYELHGNGVIRRSNNARGYPEDYSIQRISFNEVLGRLGTWTGVFIKGVQISYISGKRAYEIKLLGSGLKEDAQMNEIAIQYELPVVCSNGHWVYHKHIAGAGEGVTTIEDSTYYLVKNIDGSLHVNEVSKITSTELFKRHFETSTDYGFAPLRTR